MSLPNKFVQIDEEGCGLLQEVRLTDPVAAQELLKNIHFAENGAMVSTLAGEPVIVEAFDQPYVALQVEKQNGEWLIHIPYGLMFSFLPTSLCLDEWDRFHGKTTKGIPFVLSRKAQAQFFNLLDDYSDDSITIDKKKYEIPPLFALNPEVEKEKFWTDVYVSEGKPGWDLAAPAEALKDMLPRLKLPRSRVLVLGCGEGHDAAFFAEQGHFVTAVDVSPEAIARAQKHYGHMENLKFVMADIFKLGKDFDHAFDLVFEHTCFCAINPQKRQDLVKTWNRLLTDNGQLIGVFFSMEKPSGPPYGATEWEIRERLKKNYQFIFWGRWQKSVPRRQGKELFVYAQKKSR